MAVDFRLLGDVEVRLGDEIVDIGHLRQRCVLVALLVEADCPVPVDRLVDRVWGDHPPQRAYGTLRGYLSRLRRALAEAADVAIERRPGGYLLAVEPMSVDLHRFNRLIGRARVAPDDAAEALLDEALAVWRGVAFATMDTPWLNGVRDALDRQRHAAVLDRTDLVLARGGHTALIGELANRFAADPLDERLAGQLLLALYRCGRPAEALEHYRRLRLRVVEDLGIDPSPPLQRLYGQMLAGDPALAAPRCQRPGSTEPVVPRQLPAAPRLFVGRDRELAELGECLHAEAGRAATVVISAIGGIGGIGKTWLALQWAHRNLHRFPDGQLYVNLRGYEPAGDPLSPTAAVRGFLDALNVAPAAVPTDPDAQLGLYRSLTADKRMLIVLDNARDTEQVRPLLPGTAGCVVVVTSRHQLTGLVSGHGARSLALDVLTESESRDLLVDRVGVHRVDADPESIRFLLRLCGGLPLALGIVAARAAANPRLPLAALVEEMRDASTRLDALDAGEPPVNLRAVLSCSCRALSPAAARVFTLLGLAAGPDIGLPAAASLTVLPVQRLRALLRELVAAHLVQERAPGRYRMHDLVRLYAGEQVDCDEQPSARHRLLDHYLGTAGTAALRLYPYRDPIAVAAPVAGVTIEEIADDGAALAWFTAERPVLLAAIRQATDSGFDVHAWQLAWTLTTFLDRSGYWHEWVDTQHAALDAAGRLSDDRGCAQAHRGLARAYTQLRRWADALVHTRQALDLFDRLGDRNGQAHTHLDLARVLARQGHFRQALGHAERTLDLYRAAGNRARQASALNTVGWYHAQLGEYLRAIACCREALDLHQALGDRHGQAHTWDSLGYAQHHLGNPRAAIDCYDHAVALIRLTGDRYHEADMLTRLGDSHDAAGNPTAARDAWREAVAILDELNHADAGRIREKLRLTVDTDSLPQTTAFA